MAAENFQIVDNLVEIRTLTDEEMVRNWAAEHKIEADAVDKLFAEGFSSMEAVRLINADDLSKTKISRGQRKLIIASVESLQQRAGTNINSEAHAQPIATPPVAQTLGSSAPFTTAHASGQSTSRELPEQDGGVRRNNNMAAESTTDDPYIRAMLQQFQQGHLHARQNLSTEALQRNNLSVQNASFPGNIGLVNNPMMGLGPTAVSDSQSWRDPQIYLQAAATGKSVPTHLDITDFVTGSVEEEIVVGGNGSQQIIVKSGPKKPKLENITLAQWNVANLAILYKLVSEGKLDGSNILDYLSYTTKICQLVQRYSLVSVLLYDREYRQMQSKHNFRWGTDVPHFQTVHLVARPPRPTLPSGAKPNQFNPSNPSRQTSQKTPLTLDGKVICKLFNTRTGCHFKECRYVHQCSQSGCHQFHSATTHFQSKN